MSKGIITLPTGKSHCGVKEMAEMLGLNERTVRQEVYEGRMRHRRIGKSIRFLLPDDLDAYIETCTQGG